MKQAREVVADHLFHVSLVVRVVQPHGDETVALREDGFRELGRALRDDHRADAVLSALFGHTFDRRLGERRAVSSYAWHVVVCLLEDQKHRVPLRRGGPEIQIEQQPREHGHGDIDDFEGDTG